MTRRNEIYRMGFFGRAGAGKTSLITALTATKQATIHEQIWTVEYLRPVKEMFKDEGLFDKLKRGETLINEAKAAVANANMPAPTLVETNTTLYRFQVACAGSVRTIEVCDYAGEILTPQQLDSTESPGHELAKRIAECDAVFVFAPAEDDTDESAEDRERTEQVAEALAQLHEWIEENDPLGRSRCRPFALLVTKADRAGSSSDDNLEAMGSPANLAWNKVSSIGGTTFTKWFPLTMLPASGQPRGLIEPIVWAMDVADQTLIEQATESAVIPIIDWRPAIVGGGKKKEGLKRVTKVLRRREPMTDNDDTVLAGAVSTKKALVKSRRRYRLSLSLMTVALTWLAISVLDRTKTAGYEDIVQDPASAEADLRDAITYFETYQSRVLRYSLLGKNEDEANRLREDARSQIEELRWKKIQQETDVIQLGKIAEEYLKDGVGQEHYDEAIEIIQRANTESYRLLYTAWFKPLSTKATNNPTPAQITELMAKLSPLPQELAGKETQEQRKEREKLIASLQEAYITAVVSEERQFVVGQLENLINTKRPFEALRLITGILAQKPDLFDWPEMSLARRKLISDWKDLIASRVSELRKRQAYEDGVKTIQAAISDRQLITQELGFADPNDLAFLKNKLTNEWDKAEYEAFKNNPSLTNANDYLLSGHNKCMQKTVDDWKAWKSQQSATKNLRPNLQSIIWDVNKGAYDPLIDLYVNGKLILKKENAGDGDYGKTYKFPERQKSLEFKPNSSVSVRLVLWNDQWPWDDKHVGSFDGKLRFSELTGPAGAEKTLETADGAKHKFRICLRGLEEAPQLMEWLACR